MELDQDDNKGDSCDKDGHEEWLIDSEESTGRDVWPGLKSGNVGIKGLEILFDGGKTVSYLPLQNALKPALSLWPRSQ